jgi:glycosyltransferase involved in cell wall biosynthesis
VLTVFIATHNGGRTLPRVLDAYTQLVPPPGGWKLVLIDNGSDDDSPRILRSFLDRLPLALVSEPRRGKNRALNRGLGELEGDLAVFSDDDVLPARDWLVQLRAAADQHPECGAFGGHILPAWDVPPDEWVRDWVPSAPVFACPTHRATADRASPRRSGARTWQYARSGCGAGIDSTSASARMGRPRTRWGARRSSRCVWRSPRMSRAGTAPTPTCRTSSARGR